ncbi:MAG: PAS domain-containing protein [Clostridia bacterium]|nr:PAS domain-containing protein [Clostridia bacterium]
MKKKLNGIFILVAVASWIIGIPACIIFMMLTSKLKAGDIEDFTSVIIFALPIVITLAAVILVACIAASYISHSAKREYRQVAEPGTPEAGKYPELTPFFEMINAQQCEIEKQLARVAKEKNRLSTIINNMDEGLIILDNDLRVIMLNESAYSWLASSVPREECAGKHISEVCESREICDCIEQADSVNLTLGGRDLQLHVNHVVSSAEQVGRIGLLLDVSERSEIDRIKQEFTANVSHELKTPLTSISGYAELIESGMAKGDDAPVFAGRIRKESQRMLALISDIIKLSKLDEAPDGDIFEKVDLLKVALECRDMLEMSAEQHGVTLRVEGEKSEVMGVPTELTELIYNLIDNGIRYNRKSGEVNVKVTSPAHGIGDPITIVTVADTGIGIESEHQGRVFERFYRVDKSRSKATGGTGLGLAIVKHVAERHNAKISLDSRIGEGTTVRVEFYEMINEN